LYVKPDGSYCFQPNDPSCDDKAYQPLSCATADSSAKASDASSDDSHQSQDSSYGGESQQMGGDSSDSSHDGNSQSGSGDFCQMQCDSLSSCSTSKYGSYCKTNLGTPVCFGILVRDDGSYCFQPTDPDCDDSRYQPLSCQDYSNDSTDSSDQAYNYGSSGKKQYNSDSHDRSYDSSYCQSTCDSLSDCANSKYGSYCNMNVDQPSCFGILVRTDGSYCFEPTDPDCNDMVYKPLPCSYNEQSGGDYSDKRNGRSLRGNL
jgi:hypothetical protein